MHGDHPAIDTKVCFHWHLQGNVAVRDGSLLPIVREYLISMLQQRKREQLTFKVQWCQMVTFKSVQCHPGLAYIFNF